MTIILPLLIFLFIGVFEVGFALRTYLVLSNANREAARFAVRQNYLDFTSNHVGYEKVWTHTLESISGQIPFNEQTGVMIISHISVEANCNPPYTVITPIDIPTYTWTYPATATQQTQINYINTAQNMLLWQIKHSCEEMQYSLIPRPYSVVIVEQFMEHYQLFGFPVIANPYTNPVTLYVNTTFRIIQETR